MGAGCIQNQPVIQRINPSVGFMALRKSARQQLDDGRFLDFAHLFLTRLVTLHLLDLHDTVLRMLVDHRSGQQLFLHPESNQPMLPIGMHKIRLLVTRRQPAAALQFHLHAGLQRMLRKRFFQTIRGYISTGNTISLYISEPHN